MTRRQSNRPDRRIALQGTISSADLSRLAKTARYVGSANHKRSPGDYGFVPPSSPRPSKSLCDDEGQLLLAEAARLFSSGLRKGMISQCMPGQLPKYVWAVDSKGEVMRQKPRRDRKLPIMAIAWERMSGKCVPMFAMNGTNDDDVAEHRARAGTPGRRLP